MGSVGPSFGGRTAAFVSPQSRLPLEVIIVFMWGTPVVIISGASEPCAGIGSSPEVL